VFRNASTPGVINASTFAPRVDFGQPLNNVVGYFVGLGDLNGDGKVDAALTARGSNQALLYRNSTQAGSIDASSFASPVILTPGDDPASISVADLDGDGKADVITPNKGSNTLSIFRNITTSVTSSTLADSLALVALYNATAGNTWTNRTNWLAGDVDTWFGVTVTDFRVTGLSLAGNNLNGVLPPELGDLNFLTTLNLSGNLLSGSVPISFVNLLRLTQLELQNNNLTELPDLSDIPTFSELNIAGNKFTFEDIEPNVSVAGFIYSPQQNVVAGGVVKVDLGADLQLDVVVGGSANTYQWRKNSVPLGGATSASYQKANVVLSDGGTYDLQVNNTLAPALTLSTFPFTVSINTPVAAADSLALVALYNATAGPSWKVNTNWLTGPVYDWHGIDVINGEVVAIELEDNNLVGAIPSPLNTLTDLTLINLSRNKITALPTLTGLSVLTTFNVVQNQLQFGSLEPNIALGGFVYAPQDSLDATVSVLREIGTSQTFNVAVSGTANSYTWKKDNAVLPAQAANTLTLSNLSLLDDGVYRLEATNSTVPGLTLYSRKKIIRMSSIRRDSLALSALYQSTGGNAWTNRTNWNVTPLRSGNWFGVTVASNRVTGVNLSNNNLVGRVPAAMADLRIVTALNLSGNKLTQLPDLRDLASVATLNVSNNNLDFSSLIANAGISGINYQNQADIGVPLDTLADVGATVRFRVKSPAAGNVYQWKRNGVLVSGQTTDQVTIASLSRAMMGDYVMEITNPGVPNLTLRSAPKRVRAVATLTGKVFETASLPVTRGQILIFKITPAGSYDTLALKPAIGSDGSYSARVILDDYLLLANADAAAFPDDLPTYYKNTIFWEEADKLVVEGNQSGLDIRMQKKPTIRPQGTGSIFGYFENRQVEGRTNANERVAKAGASVRRRTRIQRPKEDQLTLVTYLFTNDQGEFDFTNLEEGEYLINLQYPGYPMDERSFINIFIGKGADRRINVEALIQANKITVNRIAITGWDEGDAEFSVYPNPASLYINIRNHLQQPGLAVLITNALGQRVLQQSMLTNGDTSVKVDGLTEGIYQVHIMSGGQQVRAFRVLVGK
jgi:Leucine-rich repeat (LRR) protein